MTARSNASIDVHGLDGVTAQYHANADSSSGGWLTVQAGRATFAVHAPAADVAAWLVRVAAEAVDHLDDAGREAVGDASERLVCALEDAGREARQEAGRDDREVCADFEQLLYKPEVTS